MEDNLLDLIGFRGGGAAILKTLVRQGMAAGLLAAMAACGGGMRIGKTGVSINKVILADRFPPDCKQGSVMCTVAPKGNQYLILWLDTTGSTTPLSLAGEAGAYVTDSSGSRYTMGSGLEIGAGLPCAEGAGGGQRFHAALERRGSDPAGEVARELFGRQRRYPYETG